MVCKYFLSDEQLRPAEDTVSPVSHYIPFTSDAEIVVLASAFQTRTLPKTSWTHAAHFAVALWLLTSHTPAEVARRMPGMIRAYNESVGTANTDISGYHETITQASIRAAHHFLATRRSEPLFQVCNALIESPFGKPDWLLAYWSRERLFSAEARREWHAPNLADLPF